MTAILDRLYRAVEQNDPAQVLISDAAEEIRRLRFELNRIEHERDLAVAHDRQPYPSAESYDQACADLESERQRADKAEFRLRESESLADFMTESLAELKSINQMLTWRTQKAREIVSRAPEGRPALDAALQTELLEVLGPESTQAR